MTCGLILAVVASIFDVGTDSDDFDVRVRQEKGSPFVCVDFAPKAGAADRILSTASLPPIRVKRTFGTKPVMQGAWGLKPLAAGRPSATYLAVAEPYTRKGAVCAYLTNLKACGAVDLGLEADGTVVFKPVVDYGRMLVRAGTAQVWETIVVGAFDDCRKGLERYADEVAKRFDIRLPPNRSGATTWCFDRFGYSDRSQFKGGCGCGTPESARQYADAAMKLRPYGFDFYQIDDQWQDGCDETINGPARNFGRCNPKGPFPNGFVPTVRDLNDRGIAAGLWFIPFGGQEREPGWAYGDIFVKSANDVPKTSHSAYRKPLPCPKRKGETCRSVWNGDPIDFSRPEGHAYLAGLVRTFTFDWGFRYLKCDGISGGFAADLYGGEEWMDQGFANAVFADPTTSNVENYRRGFETIRKNAAPGTFILACSLGSIRAMAPSFGLVDGMRIGNDNGPIDMFPARYLIGQVAGSARYFFNGRVWWADPDSVYVRKAVPYARAKSTASWVWMTDSLYECGDWLPDLPEDRVELLRRTLRHHGSKEVRPIDFFEKELPNAWLLETADGVKTLGVFNWSTNEALTVDYPFAYAGLEPDAVYEGEEMWSGERLAPFGGQFKATVPPDDCRIYRLRKVRRALAWPPVEARALADSQGLLIPAMRDGGETKRAYEVYAHGLRPEWRYRVGAQTNFVAVVPPKAGHRKGAPLVVLLHSAGCRVADGRCVRGTGPNHMGSMFRKGDCCVYSIPDDFYAVFPDCGILAGEDWWWGSKCPEGTGFRLSPCERRVLDEIEWVVQKHGIDRNRVYLAGNSMGGSGTLGLGLRHGDVFAAVKANVPAGVDHALARIGWGKDAALAASLPDPPVAIDYSAPNDSWSAGHEKLAAAMAARRYSYHFFWGSFGHCGANETVRRYNDIYSGIDWLNIRRDAAYPVFTRASTDDALPWPCDPKKSDKLPAGQVNGYFRWANRVDAPDRFEMDLRLVSSQEAASRIFAIPAEATADLTLRRVQRFTLTPGETVQWTHGGTNGTAIADATGHVTLPGLRFTTAPRRLVLERWHPATQEGFTLGADVSWITAMEQKGLTLRDREGRPKDCFELMKDFNLSAVRLRVWVDPSKHGGWCDAKDLLAKAKRARQSGHEVMVDFHYSDWWADPGKQDMPAAWCGLNRDEVLKALARHTEDVLTLLKTNGVAVKWVQVGNETDHGILWKARKDTNGKLAYVKHPNGVWSPDLLEDSFADRYRHPANYAACIRTGYDAVKRVFPAATVIVHHAEGCNAASTDDHLATLAESGAKWDLLGISLYPYHSRYRNPVEQKTIDEALATLRHVAEKWHCDTMVVETGFECIPSKYEEGRGRLAQVIRRARATPRCRGVFYWEPQCRPTHHHYPLGAFDDEGRPTPIMEGFLSE